jgi:hypothetical protein
MVRRLADLAVAGSPNRVSAGRANVGLEPSSIMRADVYDE